MTTPVMIVAGEVSGDIHAGNLLDEVHRLRPDVAAFGVGGERLTEAGLRCVASTEELAHMGLMEVVRELPRIRRVMQDLTDEAARMRPAVAILVDSPDFNLRLAARLNRLDVPVVLYVSPQLWAWRRGRVRVVRRFAREVLCLLPFEAEFYAEHGVPARYVGHPLVDDVDRDGLLGHDLARSPGRLALLPGSRGMEVRHLLPTMLGALRGLDTRVVNDAVLIEAPGVSAAIDEVLSLEGSDGRVRRVAGPGRRRALASASLAWTASGTATVECALLDVPMIVGYRLQPLSYAVARWLVRVDHIALANLIAGERAAPELIQKDWRPDRLAAATTRLLSGGTDGQLRALAAVRSRLGEPGASRRAAEAVLEHL
jgi:lipid-A-disaccharide synthase